MNKNMNKDILDYKINEIKTNLDIAFDTNQYYIDHNTIEIKKVNTVKLANLFDVEIEESDILPDFNDGILYVDNEYKKNNLNKKFRWVLISLPVIKLFSFNFTFFL